MSSVAYEGKDPLMPKPAKINAANRFENFMSHDPLH